MYTVGQKTGPFFGVNVKVLFFWLTLYIPLADEHPV